jgi:hypothetical protein
MSCVAAPEYVPRPKIDDSRVYESPPWRPDPWLADRPGELGGPQPTGLRLGAPGPDQGFALRLARQFSDRLVLVEGEDLDDVVAGCVAVALKRASLFGRAPVVYDLEVAFALWGYLDEAPEALVRLRRREFEGVAHHHHYLALRRIADLVPSETLRLAPTQVSEQVRADWKSLFRMGSNATRSSSAPDASPAPAG